jgi:hypothetical protein
MKRTTWTGLALAAALTASPALASAEPGSIMFGAPQRQTVFGELGYSGIPRIGYLHPINPRLAIGGEFILDVGLFNSLGSGIPGTVTIAGAAPIKLVVSENQEVIIGLEFTPGIGASIRQFGVSVFSTDTTLFTLLLHSEVSVGYKVNEQVIVGGGAEIPLTLFFGDANQVAIPIILGPEVEFALTPEWTITGDLKLGPHIIAGDRVFFADGVTFGFKFQAGVAYSF